MQAGSAIQREASPHLPAREADSNGQHLLAQIAGTSVEELTLAVQQEGEQQRTQGTRSRRGRTQVALPALVA